MTDRYSEGDRVRATHKRTGEVHEFEVRASTYSRLTSTTGLYFHRPFWDFEKLTPPLPTKAGLYQATRDSSDSQLLLTTHGEWFWIYFEGGYKNWPVARPVQDTSVIPHAATIIPLYLYGEES